MIYAVLTNLGKGPFQLESGFLKLSSSATLVAFKNQPDYVFSKTWAESSIKHLWPVSETTLSKNKIELPEIIFESYKEFQEFLRT